MSIRHTLLAGAACAALVSGAARADIVHVRATGTVEYNQFTVGILAGVPVGAPVVYEFDLDSNVFVADPQLPASERGYPFVNGSFHLQIGNVNAPLVANQTAMFVVRNNDPGVDGFYTGPGFSPAPIPLALGFSNKYGIDFLRTFNGGTTLSSLDILGAVGSWGYDDLSVFSFAIAFNEVSQPLGVDYQTLTISRCPSIASQPYDVTMCPLGGAVFTVAASGSGPLAYQWQVADAAGAGGWANIADGPVVVGGTEVGTASGTGGDTLTVTTADSGIGTAWQFRCVVSNACGGVTSDGAALNICVADFDCNGFANGDDFDAFSSEFFWGTPAADVNHDGFVNGDDFDYYSAHFDAGC